MFSLPGVGVCDGAPSLGRNPGPVMLVNGTGPVGAPPVNGDGAAGMLSTDADPDAGAAASPRMSGPVSCPGMPGTTGGRLLATMGLFAGLSWIASLRRMSLPVGLSCAGAGGPSNGEDPGIQGSCCLSDQLGLFRLLLLLTGLSGHLRILPAGSIDAVSHAGNNFATGSVGDSVLPAAVTVLQ